jgi:hypothetical protein
MNTKQLNAAMKIAEDKSIRFIDDNGKHLEDISVFDGFGLHSFAPVIVTLRQVAFLIRWQCFNLGGSIDSAALKEIAVAGRRKFTVIGQGA